MTSADVSVAIPTYEREEVLVATVEAVVADSQGAEVLVLDQTVRHEPTTEQALSRLDERGAIRWIRLPQPSIPAAMNEGLRQASRPVVLFLDDDVVPGPGLAAAHAACYKDPSVWAVAGQVLQPGQAPAPGSAPRRGPVSGLRTDLDFRFNTDSRTWIENCIACNVSVRREEALAVGGFDENFVGAAYRFETEFCKRLYKRGGRVLFEPAASVRHLKAPRGGTRAFGDHRWSASPAHGVGDYYFALRHGSAWEALRYGVKRPLREVCTRFHMRHPWWIPSKLVGELRALVWAARLAKAGPRYGAQR